MMRRRWVAPAAMLAVIIIGGYIVAVLRPDPSGLPLDPDSTEAYGTKAIVDVITELGGDVDVTGDLPDASDDVTLLLMDTLTASQRDDVLAWVREGGRLVVTDPSSELVPRRVGSTSIGLVEATLPRRCDIEALADVGRVAADSSTLYRVPEGATGCFERSEGAWMVVEERGEGTLVSLGGPGFLTNLSLREADNALLVVALLSPETGTRLHFMEPPGPEEPTGDQSLVDIMPAGVKLALLQLALGFLVAAAWRVRRLGKPVPEPQEVTLAGSDLVVAIGQMLQQSHSREHAAGLMLADLRSDLASRLGVPLTLADDALAEATAARTGVSREEVLAVVAAAPPASDAELLQLAAAVEELRSRLLAQAARS